MKHLISKARDLGKKAAEIRQRVQELPAHAAKIREAVTMTGGELQQLRAEVQSSIHSLKADSEDRLLTTMREINDHALVFEEAGYELTGMDLDLALNQRLAIHLDKFEDVPHATVRTLHMRQTCETTRSILAAIMKAEETAANVELSHLEHVGLVIHAGALPMIRMCWRILEPSAPETTAAAAAPASNTGPIHSTPASGSMFELRPMPASPVRVVSAPVPAAAEPAPPAVEPASAWSQSALDRFKKMPGTSKYGR
jgi:hypothetical protein